MSKGFSERGHAAHLLLVACLLAGALSRPTPAQDAGQAAHEAKARSFVVRFMQGEFEGILEEMCEPMRRAMTPEASAQVRDALVERHGPVKEIGAARYEDTIESYQRFRVGVSLERGQVDLRVVFDAEGLVAGLFHLPPETPRAGTDEETDEPAGEPVDPSALVGHWEGAIRLPATGMQVRVDLSHDTEWSGTIDIPMQSAMGLPLVGFVVQGTAITFSIGGVPGDPTFSGRLRQGAIEGTFTQGGQSFPFSLGRETLAGPARPQLPQPPFPYREVDVTFDHDDVKLAGTLTLPEGRGPFPAVVLVSGSGSQNRDEEIFGHRPFLVIADHLTRSGIAVLRYDDRGVGESTGSVRGITTADLAGDALAGLRWLSSRPEVHRDRVGVVGHSEGAIVAAMLAAEHEEVKFIVMLAGPGVPGEKLLPLQLERILRAGGVADDAVERIRVEQEKLLALVRSGASADAVREQYRRLIAVEHSAQPGAEPLTEEALDEAVEQNAEIDTPWYRFFLVHDPTTSLSRIRVPVLALFGGLDLQVPADQNLPAVRAALERAEHGDFTVEELAGLNHLFQTASTGSLAEYYTIEETIAPAVLEKVSGWILARFGPRPVAEGSTEGG